MQTVPVYPLPTKAGRSGQRSRTFQRRFGPAQIVAMVGGLAAVAVLVAAVAMRRPSTRTITIPAGFRLVAALKEALSTATAHTGETVVIETSEPLRVSRGLTLPAGLLVRGQIAQTRGGRSAGTPELAIQFTELEVQRRSYPLLTEMFRVGGKSDAPQSGADTAVATPGNQIVLPAGQRLQIKLSEPVSVEYNGKRGASRKP